MEYPSYVSEAIELLEANGYEAYIVGGSVRDTLMGRAPSDFDLTTSALPDQTLRVFEDYRTIPTGLKHGTVTVLIDSHPLEITTFRVDGEYSDLRRPDSVSFTDRISLDLSRRDFTVNAMAFSRTRGLVDLFCGVEDIERRIIRAVGEPTVRFSEDALRIMRAFRFSSQLGFEIEEGTLLAAAQMKDGLASIARERISAEFLKLICSPSPEKPLTLMVENGIFRYIFEEYTPSPALFSALSRAPRTESVRLGILMSECPEEKLAPTLSSLRLSGKQTTAAMLVARRAGTYLCGDDTAARRFIGSCGAYVEEVLLAARAMGNLDAGFEAKVRENLDRRVCTSQSSLAVNGSHLVKLGILGKDVGRTLEYLLQTVLAEPDKNTYDTLISLAKEKNNIKN